MDQITTTLYEQIKEYMAAGKKANNTCNIANPEMGQHNVPSLVCQHYHHGRQRRCAGALQCWQRLDLLMERRGKVI